MDEIMSKLVSGEYEIVENKSLRAKSDFWDEFGLLQDYEDNVVTGMRNRWGNGCLSMRTGAGFQNWTCAGRCGKMLKRGNEILSCMCKHQ